MNEQRTSKKPPRKCLFCGNGKLSDEHIWSQWSRELLPDSDGYIERSNRNRGGKPVDHRIIRDAQGSITNKRLKRVCKDCNNGWMSRLEEESRATVTALILGQSTYLARSARRPLINWIATKLIVLDAFRDGEQAFTERERSEFFATRALPQSLSIWLLSCGQGPWKTMFWTHAQRLTVVVGRTWEEAKPPSGANPNFKLFLWGVGQALIVAAYTREIDLDLGMQEDFAIRLSPDEGRCRLWVRPSTRVPSISGLKTLAMS